MNIRISYVMITFAFISLNLIFNGLGDHFPKALYIFILNLHADYHPQLADDFPIPFKLLTSVTSCFLFVLT